MQLCQHGRIQALLRLLDLHLHLTAKADGRDKKLAALPTLQPARC